MRQFREFCTDFEKKAEEAEMEKEALSPSLLSRAGEAAKSKALAHLKQSKNMAKYIRNTETLKGRLINAIKDKGFGKDFSKWSEGERKRYKHRNRTIANRKFEQSNKFLTEARERELYGHPATRGTLDKIKKRLKWGFFDETI